MTPANTAREAKEFLIAQIVQEAEREGLPLTNVERRMLYFTETAWLPEDTWQASEIFVRDYEQDVYEERIAQLTQKWKGDPQHDVRRWNEAVAGLGGEDHYLLVLTDPRLQKAPSNTLSPSVMLKIILITVAAILFIMGVIFLYIRFGE